jgi:hypothetical protein
MQAIRTILSSLITNYKGPRLNRKLVIFESDDWGSIRMPSPFALEAFSKNNFELNNSLYKVDALETNKDIESLFEVLNTFKDKNGNPAVFTANTIVANPDFEKIKESNFETYFFEPFTTTYERNDNCSRVFDLIKEGIGSNIFFPQFHGREHLNVNRWLKDLQESKARTRYSFELGSTYSGAGDYSYMEAFDWDAKSEIETHKLIIEEGLLLFKDLFGFQSKSFIPPCYNLDSDLYSFIYSLGVEILQGIKVQLEPTGEFNKYRKLPHFFMERHKSGLKFNIRNCFFEPSLNRNADWVNSCLKNIEISFLLSKPAVVSTHRINYIGSIDKRNSEIGLNQLKALLKAIIRKWPEVEFTTTNKLIDYVGN